MAAATRILAVAVVGGILGWGSPGIVCAQVPLQFAAATDAIGAVSFAIGSIGGAIKDERGVPVAGVAVSVLGASTSAAVTDKEGRFEFGTLAPGPYLVRVYHTGFVAQKAQTVLVAPSTRTMSTISMRRIGSIPPILAAGVPALVDVDAVPPAEPADPLGDASRSDQGETAWRIRHARRGVLRDLTFPVELLADSGDDTADGGFGYRNAVDVLGRAVGSPARAATSFFADTPLSGQIDLLATSSFDGPRELFSLDNLSRNMAFMRLGSPAGAQADWAVRGMVTRADIASWMLAGSYRTRAPARLRHDLGLSYSTQRYDGGNLLALREMAYANRNAGSVYAYETFAISPAATLTYGGAYGRYDYLGGRNLLSPRVELTVVPIESLRLTATVDSRALAPGAEEFLPPDDLGLWLPPQRTFSSVETGRPFEAQRTTREAVAVARDFGTSTIAVRAFREHVDDQLVTIFGSDMPGHRRAGPGHYIMGNAGDADASGCAAEFRTVLLDRVRASVEYSMANAQMLPSGDVRRLMILAPSAVRPSLERVQNLSASVETDVPETSTRVLVLYRVGNGFARSAAASNGSGRSGVDSRFDVQVRQSLPFMNFSSARWEMLLAVRNFFREPGTTQSVYDELLVVNPPRRLVGGVTLSF